jgi:hypothetical protein
MNEVRVSTTAVFNPGTKKPTPARGSATAKLNVFTLGVPAVTAKIPRAVISANQVVFEPGVKKIAPVKASVKAKVRVTRVTAKATAKPRNFVVVQKARAHAKQILTKGELAKPHDNKSASSRATHDPAVTGIRNYVTAARAISGVTFLRKLAPHDRKTATAKAVFGSFSSRPPAFSWR